ncbi:flagellar biosynthesis anti-sigma factor FlgM [Clostridium grantii]|uniref:Negative regulator of flagellin synthesis n=1 Tax=Clostridium grantii DSM 8605 TaxID=1121316 RepID=A0A1M5W798_9CLOT|nr:flagellar biosynthesis anti-sigma factor FlgM [Clostridium grantii]SHH83341.1 anti-sigma-28 factor, FlgM family [Clostridium grantii DSM 8605]
MKIYNNNYFDKNIYKNNLPDKMGKKVNSESKISGGNNGDRVEISEEGIKFKEYVDRVEQIDKANLSKIEDIKSKIQEGKYEVSSEKLAEKIMERFSMMEGE